MKIKLYVLLVCLILCAGIRAQQIVDAEYFINTDPGPGLALPITITPGFTIDQMISIPVGSIGEGLHLLGIRVLDDNGIWSLFERKNFIVEYLNATDLVAAEYFIDADPGIGNATPISITIGAAINQNLSIPIPMLTEGMHLLAIRVKNAAGKWSLFERKNFIVQYLNATDIVSAEYFIDSDPGIGYATPINITVGASVQQNLTLAIPNLSEGIHLLAIRIKNAAGKWSLFERKNFIIQPLVYDDIVAAEYFIDSDPGAGNATPVDITNGASVDEDLLLLIPNTTPVGDHNLALRVLDSRGKWSLYANHMFKVCPLITSDPTHIDASCAESTDGSAVVNPSGGMSPYTFNWSNGQTTASVTGLSPGVYHVTITGADECETVEHITIGVVVDLENPVITCPADISVATDVGECSTTISYNASVSDNCAGTTILYTPASGSSFNVGTTTVIATAIDAAGNESECTFTVMVSDNENPVMVCPSNISVSTDVGECSKAVSYSASTSDNCEGVWVSYTPASGSTFNLGTTPVTAMATDAAGNKSECTFTVNVSDDENPMVTCPADVSVSADPSECSMAVSYTASASDNCEGIALSYSHISGSTFNVGITMVTVTAIDASGNESECTFTIAVSDDEDPAITCPGPKVETTDEGSCSKNVSYTASASDNCEMASVTCSPTSGSSFNIGVTTVTVTATDINGNVNSCTFTVTINALPEICDNDIDDNCDGEVDEGCGGTDTDGDGVEDEDDNCPAHANPNQEDSDCDSVGDACDVCPGGDDTIDNNNDGQPDCHVYPGFSNLPSSWKCGNKNDKVLICHNDNNPHTICVAQAAVQAHLNHGDYLGNCDESHCNGNLRNEDHETFSPQSHFDQSQEFEKQTNVRIQLFPNPVKDNMEIHINGNLEKGHLSIWDVFGNLIWQTELSLFTKKIGLTKSDMRAWQASGIYFIRFEHDGKLEFIKFITLND